MDGFDKAKILEKYKLNGLETDNITRIKQDDVKKMIVIANEVCTQIHHGTKMKFLTNDFINSINPMTAYRKLVDAMDYALDRYRISDEAGYSRPGWEDCNYDKESRHEKDVEDLYNMLQDTRMSLINAVKAKALDEKEFRNEYKRNEVADHQNIVELGNIANGDKREKDLKDIENGWISPRFNENSYEFDYSPWFKDKDGQMRDLHSVELADYTTYGFDVEKEKARLKNDVERDYRKRQENIEKIESFYGRGANFIKILDNMER